MRDPSGEPPVKAITRAQEKVAAAIKALTKSAKKGRVARRNARAALFGAIKSLKAAVDADFPLEPKPKPLLDMTLAGKADRYTFERFQRLCIDTLALDEFPASLEEIQAYHCAAADAFGTASRVVVATPANFVGSRVSLIDDDYLYIDIEDYPSWRQIIQEHGHVWSGTRLRATGKNRMILKLCEVYADDSWRKLVGEQDSQKQIS
jgi:hypothetical protein